MGGTFVYGPIHLLPNQIVTFDAEPGFDWRDRVLMLSGMIIEVDQQIDGVAIKDLRPGGTQGIYLRGVPDVAVFYVLPPVFWTAGGWDGASARGGATQKTWTGLIRRDINQLADFYRLYADSSTGELKFQNGSGVATITGFLSILATEQTTQIITSGL